MTASPGRIAALAGGLVLVAVLAIVFTASNVVPSSSVGRSQQAIGAQDLAPPQCAGMGLTTVVTNGNGSAGNDLVLGTAAGETLDGNNGNDCVVGGAGNDTVRGDAGTDVCIGGGDPKDKFVQCETTYP